MPIFDYSCPRCNITAEHFVHRYDDLVQCSVCLISMNKLASVPQMHIFPNGGIHLKHVEPGGKTFHSKNEMKKYAREHNMELGALL